MHERSEEAKMMTKILIGLLGAAVIATGGYAAATGVDHDPARTVSLPSATDGTTGATDTAGTTTTDGAGDISGPCDEAEHRNDPRCTGVTVPPRAPATTTGGTTTDDAGDISGPCDEAEHRNDPRCTGAATDRDDDNSGPGRGDDDGDHDNSGPGGGGGDDDRSGSNSGKG
jgi:hypothetical protein